MVVLSAAVCTKGGKALLTRQYVDMSRVRVEGLLAAFPKLMSSETKKEHTFIETESVRYVYHPLEGLYLLLVTNKGSNIMEDLDTLALLSKVVPDICGMVTAESVSDRAYDLVFAFDEVVTYGGYRENVNMAQIRTNMEMESHEEKLAILIRISKMNEAKEEAKRKATEMREARKASGMSGMGGGDSMAGFGSDSAGAGGGRGGRGGGGYEAPPAPKPKPAVDPAPSRRAPGRGMKLGSKSTKGASSMDAMFREEGIDAAAASSTGAGAGAATAADATATAAPMAAAQGVECRLEEKLTVAMTRDGSLESMEVKGTLTVTVQVPECTRSRVILQRGDTTGFQFQSHPNISKPRFNNDAVLELKDPSRELPVGTGVGVLRWRSTTRDESKVPLVINCWPEEVGGGEINVNIEYTLQRTDIELNNVYISIPLGGTSAPVIVSCDGQYKHNSREQSLLWQLEMVDASNATGTLEFNIAGRDPDAFFPLNLGFDSVSTLCPIKVTEVQSVETGETLPTLPTTRMEVESYVVSPE